MSAWGFFKDRFLLFVLHLVCMSVLSLFLKLTGYGGGNIFLILIFYTMIAGVWFFVNYLERRKYFRELAQILEKTDQRYLLGELMPHSFRLEDRLYRDIIRRSNKSVIERIKQIERDKKDYQEYIESWVHEVKAPITGIELLCENGKHMQESSSARQTLRSISQENQKIENYVDMVIYYARSENVYKDFLIRQTNLQEIAGEVLAKNRLLLIEHNVRAEVNCPDIVYTDSKWIAFILNQILLNSVKYCKSTPVFTISTRRTANGVCLTFEDNGAGIREEELSRIFEKGFTGSNGRSFKHATGMGLYLCQKLCGRLGIEIRASSVFGKGTKLFLLFPISNYISRLNDSGDRPQDSGKQSHGNLTKT